MRPRVHVTSPVPQRITDALARDFELVDEPGAADGILATPDVAIDAAYLSTTGPSLEIVANYATGVDNVDLDAAGLRGLVVANTPDVLTRATAELAVALMLALLRRVCEGDRLIRSREPWRFATEFMLGSSLDGKRLGIVGRGRIGRETARLAEAFGAVPLFAGRDDPLEPLLERSDIVSLHCPLTPQTRHLIGAEQLRRMKPTAVLVNTSRGPVVDEGALVAALESGTIAGAALDVYENEPQVDERLPLLDNVVLTPHLGSATRETREAMGMLAVDALRAVLIERRLPENRVLPAPAS